MMEYELIKLDNQHIKFKMAGNSFSVRRIFIESKFKEIYWFAGNLEQRIQAAFLENPEWFKKYVVL